MTSERIARPLRVSGLEEETNGDGGSGTVSPQVLAYHEAEVSKVRHRLRETARGIEEVESAREYVFVARDHHRAELEKHVALLNKELERLRAQFHVVPGVDQWLRTVHTVSTSPGAAAKLATLSEALESLPRVAQFHRLSDRDFSDGVLQSTREWLTGDHPNPALVAALIEAQAQGEEEQNVQLLIQRLHTNPSEAFVLQILQRIVRANAKQLGAAFDEEEARAVQSLALSNIAKLRGAQVLDAGDAIEAAALLLETLQTFAHVELPADFEARLREGRLAKADADSIRATLTTLLRDVRAGAFDLLFSGNRAQKLALDLERIRVALRQRGAAALRQRGAADMDVLAVTPTLVDLPSRIVTVRKAENALRTVERELVRWSTQLDALRDGAPSLSELRDWFRQRSPSANADAARLNEVRQTLLLRLADIDEVHRTSTAADNSVRMREQLAGLRWAQEALTRAYSTALRQLEAVRRVGRRVRLFRLRAGDSFWRYIDICGGTPPYTLSLHSQAPLDAALVSQLRVEAADIGAQMEQDFVPGKGGGVTPAYEAVARMGDPRYVFIDVLREGARSLTRNRERLRVGGTLTLAHGGRVYLHIASLRDWHTGRWHLRVEDSGVSSAARDRLNEIRDMVSEKMFSEGSLGMAPADASARGAQAYAHLIGEAEDDDVFSEVLAAQLRAYGEDTQPFGGAVDVRGINSFFKTRTRELFQVQEDSQRFNLYVLAAHCCVRCSAHFSELAGNAFGACEFDLAPTPFERALLSRARTYRPPSERSAALAATPVARELQAAEEEHAHIVSFLSEPSTTLALLELRQAAAGVNRSPGDARARARYDALFYDSPKQAAIDLARRDHGVVTKRIHALQERYRKLAEPKLRDAVLDEAWERRTPTKAYAHDTFSERLATLRTQKQQEGGGGGSGGERAWIGRHSTTEWLPTPANETYPHRRPTESRHSCFRYARFAPRRDALAGAYSFEELLFMQASQYVGLLAGNGGGGSGGSGGSIDSSQGKYGWAKQSASRSNSVAEESAREKKRQALLSRLEVTRDVHWRNLAGYVYTRTLRVRLPLAVFDARDPVVRSYVERSMLSTEGWREQPASKRVVLLVGTTAENLRNVMKLMEKAIATGMSKEQGEAELGRLLGDAEKTPLQTFIKARLPEQSPALIRFEGELSHTEKLTGIEPHSGLSDMETFRKARGIFARFFKIMVTANYDALVALDEVSISLALEQPYLRALRLGAFARHVAPFHDSDDDDDDDDDDDGGGGSIWESDTTKWVTVVEHTHDPSNDNDNFRRRGGFLGSSSYSTDTDEHTDKDADEDTYSDDGDSHGEHSHENLSSDSGESLDIIEWLLESSGESSNEEIIESRFVSVSPFAPTSDAHLMLTSGKEEEEEEDAVEEDEGVAASMFSYMEANGKLPRHDLEVDSDEFADTFEDVTATATATATEIPAYTSPFAAAAAATATATPSLSEASVLASKFVEQLDSMQLEDNSLARASGLARVTQEHTQQLAQLQNDWKTMLESATSTMQIMRKQLSARMRANDTAAITTWLQGCSSMHERLLKKESTLRRLAASQKQALQNVLAEHGVPLHTE